MALRVTGVLGLDGTPFHQTLTRADIAVRRFGTGVAAHFAGLFTIGAVGIAIHKTIEYATRITDLAGRTGKSVESLQRFDRWTKNNATSLEQLIRFWEKLEVARAKALGGNQASQQAFAKFGITTAQLKTTGSDELTKIISQAYSKAANTDALVAPLKEIGGRGAMALAAAFREGFTDEYEKMRVMNAEEADTLKELSDKWNDLNQALKILVAGPLVQAIDGIKEFTRYLNYLIPVLMQTKVGLRGGAEGALKGMESPWAIFQGGFGGIGMAARLISGFFKGYRKAELEGGDALAGGIEAANRESAAADKARQAARIARRLRGPQGGFLGDAGGRFVPLQSDTLIRVGNFLGTNRNVLESLANRQVQLLVRIEEHTRKMADQSSGDSNEDGLT